VNVISWIKLDSNTLHANEHIAEKILREKRRNQDCSPKVEYTSLFDQTKDPDLNLPSFPSGDRFWICARLSEQLDFVVCCSANENQARIWLNKQTNPNEIYSLGCPYIFPSGYSSHFYESKIEEWKCIGLVWILLIYDSMWDLFSFDLEVNNVRQLLKLCYYVVKKGTMNITKQPTTLLTLMSSKVINRMYLKIAMLSTHVCMHVCRNILIFIVLNYII